MMGVSSSGYTPVSKAVLSLMAQSVVWLFNRIKSVALLWHAQKSLLFAAAQQNEKHMKRVSKHILPDWGGGFCLDHVIWVQFQAKTAVHSRYKISANTLA